VNLSLFAENADVPNIETGFSLGKIGQLRMASAPVTQVLSESFLDDISTSTWSSSECFSFLSRECDRGEQLVGAPPASL